MKKSLPNYLESLNKVENSKSRNVKLNALIVSKNQLLKDVFDDENFKITSGYELSFMHLFICNKQADEDI